MRKQWFLLFTLLFALLIVLLSIANVDNVTFSFLVGKMRLPLILVIVGSVVLGALLVGSFAYIRIYRQQREIRQLRKQLRRINELQPDEDSSAPGSSESAGEQAEESRLASRKSRRKENR